jgi:uncharacterized repeat protein (TIGR03803 family)
MTWSKSLNRVTTIAAIGLGLCVTAEAAPKYQVLHAFGKGTDGGGLWTSVTLDKKGNLFGATSGGGKYKGGVIFRLTPKPNGHWTETILHSFPSSSNDGGDPNGGLIQDALGNWYGTTGGGGADHVGTVFKLMHGPSGWMVSILYSFGEQGRDGYGPTAGLAMDRSGNLYGTAPRPWTTAFELTPGSDGWHETIMHHFGVTKGDGAGPYSGLILDSARNLYGTTEWGGIGCVGEGCGTVYEIQRTSSGWKEVVLHRFDNNGTDGVGPGFGALFMDDSGNLYGTTVGGGSHTCFAGEIRAFAIPSGAGYFPGNAIGNCGTIFKLTKLADGSWKENILYNFKGGAAGSGPGAGVVMDKAGNLYGTTIYGGSGGSGVVYKLAPGAKGKWTYTLLHTFSGADGAQPDANLILDDKGNLYGTTATGGANGGGVVFEITP